MEDAQPKTRVLIVDDDQTLCDMYAERLKAEGYDVAVAHNGEEGAAKAVEYLPHVILLDLMMPKVNGFNTLEILKSTEETKNIPVLLLTALIQEENKRRGIQAGAEDYIIKSETMPGAVIEKIKAAVEKGKRMQQAGTKVDNNSPDQMTPPPVSPEPTPAPEVAPTPQPETMPPPAPPITPESMEQQPPVASPPAEPSAPVDRSQSATPPTPQQPQEPAPREELQTSFPPKTPDSSIPPVPPPPPPQP